MGYTYNNLKQIKDLRHEVILDKTQTYHDALFKLIIIGDSGIGKSCVLNRLIEDEANYLFLSIIDIVVITALGSYTH